MTPPPSTLIAKGSVVVYHLHDIGYSIDIARATELLAGREPVRALPGRGEAAAIRIQNPPIDVLLGETTAPVAGVPQTIKFSARIFDFGVCSIRASINAEHGLKWEEYAQLGADADSSQSLATAMDAQLQQLVQLLGPAIERPGIAQVTESYVVFRVTELQHVDNETPNIIEPSDADLVLLLLNEREELSEAARRELLVNRFSYYADELTVLTWDNALVIERRAQDHDVEYILEFANAQLLELRFYDEMLDRELPRMSERVASARRKRFQPTRRFSPLLSEMQTRFADLTETVERVENAIKVTDDVHLARIYAAALKLFREEAWRRGIDRKLAIMRETYGMLNDAAVAARSELLEIAIVVLIVFEIVLGLTLHR